MTKYEWERQLKKGISGLPKAEQQRVLDYYNELFADKIDAGLREQYIISEFGNPYDVANKILVDFYNEGKENPEVDAYIYADSDDIDVAFDDAEEPKAVQPPQRKTWEERRDRRREENRGQTQSQGQDEQTQPVSKSAQKKARGAGGLITMLCILLYCILGAFFNLWHPGWLIFLLMPCVITLVEAVIKRNYRIFAYPVFVTCLFLCFGYFGGKWHPAWVLFITIPLYYVLGDYICKNDKKNDVKQDVKKQNAKQAQADPIADKQASAQQYPTEVITASNSRKKSQNVFSVIVKVLLAMLLMCVAVFMWWCVISMFIGGIGMMMGGIGIFVSSFFAGAATVDFVLLGAGIALFGLGLIFTFGMAALFKPCFKACKTFVKTIKNTFNDKEKA